MIDNNNSYHNYINQYTECYISNTLIMPSGITMDLLERKHITAINLREKFPLVDPLYALLQRTPVGKNIPFSIEDCQIVQLIDFGTTSDAHWYYDYKAEVGPIGAIHVFASNIKLITRSMDVIHQYGDNPTIVQSYICDLCSWELVVDFISLNGTKQYRCEICDHVTVIDD